MRLPLGLLLVALTLSGCEASDPAQCKRPAGRGISTIYQVIDGGYEASDSQEYYNPGDVIYVGCQDGYYTPHGTHTCQSTGTGSNWDPPVSCTEKCEKSGFLDQNLVFIPHRRYYEPNAWVTVTCIQGFKSTEGAVRCKREGGVWDPDAGSIKCIQRCKEPAGPGIETIYPLYVQYSATDFPEYYNPEDVIEVRCHVGFYSEERRYTCRYSSTGSDWDPPVSCTALVPLQIVKYPNIAENAVKWRLKTSRGIVTGYQMNISAQRDYNNSFAENESHRFPPNVTEFQIPFKHGTNYTITLGGLTSAGAGGYTEWSLETPIADPPLPIGNIWGVDLHLLPVPDINGPIRTYEIILAMGQTDHSSDVCMGYNSTHYHSNVSRYTAALLPAQNVSQAVTLTLGDGLHYSGFFNAPLISNETYTVYVRVSSKWREMEKFSCSLVGTFTGGKWHVIKAYLRVSRIVKFLLVVLIPAVLACVIVQRKCQKGSAAQLKEKPGIIYQNTENL